MACVLRRLWSRRLSLFLELGFSLSVIVLFRIGKAIPRWITKGTRFLNIFTRKVVLLARMVKSIGCTYLCRFANYVFVWTLV